MKSRLAALIVLAALFAWPLVALARPGGGQSYHAAPSHSSSSYSSHSYSHSSGPIVVVPGGGGSLSPGQALIFFIIVAIVVIYVLVKKNAASGERATVQVDTAARDDGLAALRAQDPSFDVDAFTRRTADVMAKVNEAWCAGNMGPARRFISDGVYVRFQAQLQILKQQGLRNAMADWRVVGGELLQAESDAQWDTVHMRMTGSARDADVPATLTAQQAADKAKSAPQQQYQEVWSFLRRRGMKSKAGVPALEGKCPNCGADLPISDVVRCEFCKAVVNSGEHDWVLAEITQPEEWRPSAVSDDIQGFTALEQKDATISRQELEDRASVVFWKWIDARISGSRVKLERFCLTPGQPPVDHVQLRDVAVGSAELVSVEVDNGGYDRCEIDVVWSARVNGGEPQNQTSRVILTRLTSVTSKRGLSSLDCPNCGGPLADSDLAKCNYCGEPLAGGKAEWSLEAVA